MIQVKLDPPAIDFALTPYGNYCEAATPCYPHPPYGAWIGNAECISEVKTDFAGVPRPNRPPNTLFAGDTGCDLGAFQYVPPNPVPPPITVTVTPPSNLREVK
jgi:hypothetical protein